ncbi:MAG: type II toxin-antitoxin system prevent-host-death family antitoxin [Acidimicrobiales bacterium]
MSATEAARNFAELLDAVEHRGERILIARRGRVIAQIEPVAKGRGADVKSLLKRHPADAEWIVTIKEARDLAISEDRF